ncbi:TetR/AcrR family transcriptional regulator [Planococcus dechangensis]|uniref:TetR/AcrR family transcriptional regulator n=1 Tax=Planococcus dechangensis TaxID=1176255 RepID=A0ABV9MEA1_9BACL
MTSAKKTIMEAFLNMLSERNFEELSVKDIANFAGVSRSTFYLHFTDKFELMEELRHNLNGRLLQMYAEDSPAEAINLKVCRHIFSYRSFYRQEFSDANRIHELTSRLADQVQSVFGDEDMAVFAGWGTIGYLAAWVKGGFVMGPGEAADKLMKIISADWKTDRAKEHDRIS